MGDLHMVNFAQSLSNPFSSLWILRGCNSCSLSGIHVTVFVTQPEVGVEFLPLSLPGTLVLFGAGRSMARWEDVNVVITFLIIANF